MFLDLSTLEPYEDQWDYLSTLERLTPRQVAKLDGQLREPAVGVRVKHARPAKSTPDAASARTDRPSDPGRRYPDSGLGVKPFAVCDTEGRGLDVQPSLLRPATSSSIDLEHPPNHHLANERFVPDADGAPLIVVATGHFVGEGFDCPALDTLFLAGPVSFKGRLVQYAGRVLRAHPGKRTAEVHDYHDAEMPVLAAALAKRAPGYVSLGFPDPRAT